MRALLFSEWATIRASMRQYVVVTLIMAFVIGVIGGTFGDGGASAAEAASVVRTAVIPSVSIMMTFFVFFALFGADERDGWEAVRLTLPVARRQVVTARYIVMIVALAASTLASALAGALAGVGYAWFRFGVLVAPPLDEIAAVCVALVAVFAAYVAIQMPVFFRWGLAKARPYFNVPALVILLLALGPLHLAMDAGLVSPGAVSLTQVGTQVGVGIGSALDGVWPLLLIMLVPCALIYLVSMRISQRLYANRDF